MATAFERQPLPLLKAARLWRDDPDNDRNQRELCEAVDALPSETPASVDTSAPLVALLDHALDHHRAIIAMASAVPGTKRSSGALVNLDGNDDVERVLRLWTSANHFTLRDVTFTYDASADYPHGYTIRAIRIYAREPSAPDWHGGELLCAQWPTVAIVPAVTASAVTSALREPHWTSDHTTALDARDNEVITKGAE